MAYLQDWLEVAVLHEKAYAKELAILSREDQSVWGPMTKMAAIRFEFATDHREDLERQIYALEAEWIDLWCNQMGTFDGSA